MVGCVGVASLACNSCCNLGAGTLVPGEHQLLLLAAPDAQLSVVLVVDSCFRCEVDLGDYCVHIGYTLGAIDLL